VRVLTPGGRDPPPSCTRSGVVGSDGEENVWVRVSECVCVCVCRGGGCDRE